MVGGIVIALLLIAQIMLLFQVGLFSGFFLLRLRFHFAFKFIPSHFKSRTGLKKKKKEENILSFFPLQFSGGDGGCEKNAFSALPNVLLSISSL